MNTLTSLSAGLLLLLLMAPLEGAPAAPPPPLAQGLIGYWTFDASGADLSGAARTLNIAGGAGFAAGKRGQALDLHANSSQFAVRPVNDPVYNLGLGDFTFQFWVNLNSSSEVQTVVEKFNGQDGPGFTLYYDGNGAWEIDLFDSIFSGVGVSSGNVGVTAGAWYHVLLRRTGTLFQFFVNGTAAGSGVTSMSIGSVAQPLLIGVRNQSGQFPLDGRLDELALWNRAVSDPEIQAIYNYGQGRSLLEAAPVVTVGPPSTITANQNYAGSMFIIDPGSTSWDVTLAFGDGSAPLSVNGLLSTSLSFNHVYATATGSPFTLDATVLSNQGASNSGTVQVTVIGAQQVVIQLKTAVQALAVQQSLRPSYATLLTQVLDSALVRINQGQGAAAAALLRSFNAYVARYMAAALIPLAQGQQLIVSANAAIAALGP